MKKKLREDKPPIVAMVDCECFKLSNQCVHKNYERALIRRTAQVKDG